MAARLRRRRGGLLRFLLFLSLLGCIGRRSLRGGRHPSCFAGRGAVPAAAASRGSLLRACRWPGSSRGGPVRRRGERSAALPLALNKRCSPRLVHILASTLLVPRTTLREGPLPTPRLDESCAPRRRRFPKTAGTWRVARRFVRAAPRTERPEESQRCSHCLGRRSLWARSPRLGCPQRPVLPTFELGARRTATRRAGRPPP